MHDRARRGVKIWKNHTHTLACCAPSPLSTFCLHPIAPVWPRARRFPRSPVLAHCSRARAWAAWCRSPRRTTHGSACLRVCAAGCTRWMLTCSRTKRRHLRSTSRWARGRARLRAYSAAVAGLGCAMAACASQSRLTGGGCIWVGGRGGIHDSVLWRMTCCTHVNQPIPWHWLPMPSILLSLGLGLKRPHQERLALADCLCSAM